MLRQMRGRLIHWRSLHPAHISPLCSNCVVMCGNCVVMCGNCVVMCGNCVVIVISISNISYIKSDCMVIGALSILLIFV